MKTLMIFAEANWIAFFSNLSRAKGMATMASVSMTKVSQVINSGCCATPMEDAMGAEKRMNTKDKGTLISSTLVWARLKIRFKSAPGLVANRK